MSHFIKPLHEIHCCVYRIVCFETGQFYIGSSTDMEARIWKHRSLLRKNKHPNKTLQDLYNLYGTMSIKFECLEDCEPEAVLIREQAHIDACYDDPKCFNVTRFTQDNKFSRKKLEE